MNQQMVLERQCDSQSCISVDRTHSATRSEHGSLFIRYSPRFLRVRVRVPRSTENQRVYGTEFMMLATCAVVDETRNYGNYIDNPIFENGIEPGTSSYCITTRFSVSGESIRSISKAGRKSAARLALVSARAEQEEAYVQAALHSKT